MTLSYSVNEAALAAYIQAEGAMACTYDRGAMDCSRDIGAMDCELDERGTFDSTLDERGTMMLSLICTVNNIPTVITVACTSDGTPLITLDGEYLLIQG